MKLNDIKDSIAVDMKDVKMADEITVKSIGKYALIRLIGVSIFLLGFLGIIAILHLFGISISIGH